MPEKGNVNNHFNRDLLKNISYLKNNNKDNVSQEVLF